MVKFDQLYSLLISEYENTAGSGGTLGTSTTTNWTAAGTPGTDSYAPGDYRKPVALGAKKIGKGRKRKTKFLIQRRSLVSN